MENYLTKVKQGQFAHSSLKLTPRSQNHPIKQIKHLGEIDGASQLTCLRPPDTSAFEP